MVGKNVPDGRKKSEIDEIGPDAIEEGNQADAF